MRNNAGVREMIGRTRVGQLTTFCLRVAIGVLGLALLGACDEPGNRLPAVAARVDQTSLSGISAGAYMAGQFQMAHSRDVIGVGLIAGGPYGCAESTYAGLMPGPGATFLNLSKAMNGCMLNALQPWGIPDPAQLARRARQFADEGKIDPVEHVLNDRVYVFAGREDRTVVPEIVSSAVAFYLALGVPNGSISFVSNFPAGHALVTADWGGSCDQTASPYIVDCNYDQVGAMLNHIYGELKPKVAQPAGETHAFDQREFVGDLPEHGLGDSGVVYVPPDCHESGGCRVHVVLHGCAQSQAAIGDVLVAHTGYLGWADANRLIVLFPQVRSTPANPQACWDWWGYTGAKFLTRDAPQIVAIRRMLERLAAPRSMI
jgi:hypothetical protein